MRDVARIELGAADYSLRSLLDNKQAVAFRSSISRLERIEISDNVRKTMAELKQYMPEGVDYRIVYDPTQFVRASIEAVIHTLLEAVALVVLVVILFLQTWRASIIPLIAVPVSIIGTFAVMHVFGFSINALTLFGWCSPSASWSTTPSWLSRTSSAILKMVCRRAKRPYRPCARFRVRSSPLRWCLSLCSCRSRSSRAWTGQFYKQFALTIAISTVISAVNSLTLSPALAARSSQRPRRAQGLADSCHGLCVRMVLQTVQSRVQLGSDAYSGGVRRLLGHKAIAFFVYLVLIGVAGGLFKAVPGGFVPGQDKQYLVGFAQLPDGATLDRTEDVIRRMSDITLKTPGRRKRGRIPRPLDQRIHEQLELRNRVCDVEAVRRASLCRAQRTGYRDEAQSGICCHQGRVHRDVPAAAGARSGDDRWV